MEFHDDLRIAGRHMRRQVCSRSFLRARGRTGLVGLAIPGKTGDDRQCLMCILRTEPVEAARDFFVHLTTITIGLLIALSMEGCVEWQHHRHLVREADASLRMEIRNNSKAWRKTWRGAQRTEGVDPGSGD